MKSTLLYNCTLFREGALEKGDLLIENDRIAQIGSDLYTNRQPDWDLLDGQGKLLMPGVIDDQVHFRDPGFTHKGDLHSESRAALLGGVTSFMEMPNTNPQTVTIEALEQKMDKAAQVSPVNYSFYLGATNDNLPEIQKIDPRRVCGVKIFMGSSYGNMLVDNPVALEAIFRESPVLITTHCEDTPTILQMEQQAREKYGEEVPMQEHAAIRSAKACYLSSSLAVQLAKKTGARLHILHLSTAKEMELFSQEPLSPSKKITAEVCVHHLFFCDQDYAAKGAFIKWNPSIKYEQDREALRQALRNGTLDVIATDHAPHTMEEKGRSYFKAPSGGPLVQFSLLAMLTLVERGVFPLELVLHKMTEAPATLYNVKERGFLREGYFADLLLVNLDAGTPVNANMVASKCGWSPFEGDTLHGSIEKVWVNGVAKAQNGVIINENPGMRLEFDR
jgi:dihydroorotase